MDKKINTTSKKKGTALRIIALALFFFFPVNEIGQLNVSADTGSIIRHAREASVGIKTPSGSGSGFFISKNGYILTNKHVLIKDNEYFPELFSAMKWQREEEGSLKTEEKWLKKKYKRLTYLENRMRENIAHGRHWRYLDEEHIALKPEYYFRQQSYNKRLYMYEKITKVKAVFFDGKTCSISVISISGVYDLALLKFDGHETPFLTSEQGGQCSVGDKLYAIGNPMGNMVHSVSSGILSAWVEMNGQQWIQTDTLINPGNSGGPLITENGQVIGLNTLTRNNAIGINLALPIGIAFREFAEYQIK